MHTRLCVVSQLGSDYFPSHALATTSTVMPCCYANWRLKRRMTLIFAHVFTCTSMETAFVLSILIANHFASLFLPSHRRVVLVVLVIRQINARWKGGEQVTGLGAT